MVLNSNLPHLVMDLYYSYSNTQHLLPGMQQHYVSPEPQYLFAAQIPGQYSPYVPDSCCLNSSNDTQVITHQENDASCSHGTDDYALQEFAQYNAYVPDEYGNGLLLKEIGWIPLYSPTPTRTGPISLEPTSTPPTPVHKVPSCSTPGLQIEGEQTLFSISDPHAMCPPDCIAKIRDQMEEMKRRELQRLIEYSRRNEGRYTDNTAVRYIVKE